MTTMQSLLTDEGLLGCQDNQLNGNYIKLVEFGISEQLGVFDKVRTYDTLEPLWVQLPISGSIPISAQTRELRLSIPPNVIDVNGNIVNENKLINEVYLFGETFGEIISVDLPNNEINVSSEFYESTLTGNPIRFTKEVDAILPSGLIVNKNYFVIKSTTNKIKIATTKDNALIENAFIFSDIGTGTFRLCKFYLFAFGQFSPTPLAYTYTGETKLRGQLTITNLNTFALQFTYTQAQEISDHNLDPNAHQEIQSALNFNGIYVNNINFQYKGQPYIRDAVFKNTVANNMLVYLNADGKYYPALSTTGALSEWKGIAKLSDNKVITSGVIDIGHSYNRNVKLYLSSLTAGTVTDTPTAHYIGISLGAGRILLNSDISSGGATLLGNLNDVSLNSTQSTQVLMIDPTGSTTNWQNQSLLLKYNSDVKDDLTPADKHVLFFNTQWDSKQLQINDLENFNVISPSGKYLFNDGSNFIASDLRIPVSDPTNTFNTIKGFIFGAGFTVTQTSNIATVNFAAGGGGGGLSAVQDDPLPKLGGNLDVYKGDNQIRPLTSFSTLALLPSSNIFTDNGGSVNFLTTPNILNGHLLRLIINSVETIVVIASVIDAHNLLLNNDIPDIQPTDIVEYEIVEPLVYKITNTNPYINNNKTVEIDKLKATLGGNLLLEGNYILSNNNIQLSTSNGNINISGTLGISIFTSTGSISISNQNSFVDINNWRFNKGTGAKTFNIPSISTLPSIGQSLSVTSIDALNGIATLGFITAGTFGNDDVIDADSGTLTNFVRRQVYPAQVDGKARIRGLRRGTNIILDKVDSSGNVVTSDTDWVNTKITAEMRMLNKSYGSASITTVGQSPDSNGVTAIASYGVRGASGITVSLETDPTDSTKKNIVISGSGSSGGLALNGTYTVSSGTGLTMNVTTGTGFSTALNNTGNTGYYAQGIGGMKGTGFHAFSNYVNYQASQSNYGFYATSSVLNPINLVQQTITPSALDAGTIIYGTTIAGGLGFYVKIGTSLYKLALQGGAITN